jgi:putative ABC transport system permease protein
MQPAPAQVQSHHHWRKTPAERRGDIGYCILVCIQYLAVVAPSTNTLSRPPMLSPTSLRHAVRRLRRAPSFAVAAGLTLALGIGGTIAVFSVVNGVLLQPLPYPHADRLVDLSHTLALSGLTRVDQSDATYLLYRRGNRVFTDAGVYRATAVNMRAADVPAGGSVSTERAAATLVTPSVFHLLGVGSERGRALTDADALPGAPAVVVISHGLWARDFGTDAGIVGRRLSVDGVDHEIVGVMPPGFEFPTPEIALWLPLRFDPAHTKSAGFDYRGIARLRDGVSLTAATSDLQRLLPQVPVVFPGRLSAAAIAVTHMAAVVRPLRDVMVSGVARILWIVLGSVGVLLFIACANVANLFLARAEGRQREFAVRRALGAGRSALIEDCVAEAAVLCAVGGALGLALASAGVGVLKGLPMSAGIPRLGDVRLGGLVAAFAVGVSVLAAVVVSAMPVLRTAHGSLAALLANEGRAATGTASRHRARRALVISQVALALVLLSGAGLFARSFERLRAVDPGFDAEHALSFRLALPTVAYPAGGDVARALVSTLEALRALPGFESAGLATRLPLDAEAAQDSAVFVEDHPTPAGKIPDIHPMVFATPGYFAAMRIPLVAGRLFAAPDPARTPREVVVSEAFAVRYWSASAALGKRIRMTPADPWSTIVGVVGSMHDDGLERAPAQVVYIPILTRTVSGMPWTPRNVAVVVRTAGADDAIGAAIRKAVRGVVPEVPVYRMLPLRDLLSAAVSRTTFTLLLIGIAAVVAVAIGAMGIYGVIAYLVALRTREIGLRLALGAQSSDVRRMVVRRAVADAAIGVGMGLAGAMMSTRALAALLFDVNPVDPVSLGAAAALLLATAVAASWAPARRAARLDPAVALRAE